eukprot:comp26974_c0_seq1/m.62495 comp26974_c0_seq1/g.62495  ORF comp26974_c0_seq1/g.62495 comp26974_c0_seq1/m.62495 type:complete len:167 (-) comp26974_c0_seq1:53-553(-)
MGKVLVVGATGVGKSALVSRALGGGFPANHIATMGWDIYTKHITVNNEKHELQLWDTGGRERLRVLIAQEYTSDVTGMVLVYSCVDENSMRELRFWNNEIVRAMPTISTVLVSNKSDLADEIKITELDGKNQADRWGMAFFHVSAARDNDRVIEEIFEKLVANATS